MHEAERRQRINELLSNGSDFPREAYEIVHDALVQAMNRKHGSQAVKSGKACDVEAEDILNELIQVAHDRYGRFASLILKDFGIQNERHAAKVLLDLAKVEIIALAAHETRPRILSVDVDFPKRLSDFKFPTKRLDVAKALADWERRKIDLSPFQH